MDCEAVMPFTCGTNNVGIGTCGTNNVGIGYEFFYLALCKSNDRRKEKKELHTLLDMLDREKALRYPRKVIQSVAHEYMMEFWKRQQDNTDEFDPDPDPLLDDEGEIILYPNGGGGGKGAIVDWLLRYNNFFHDIRKENILTEAMRQSILD